MKNSIGKAVIIILLLTFISCIICIMAGQSNSDVAPNYWNFESIKDAFLPLLFYTGLTFLFHQGLSFLLLRGGTKLNIWVSGIIAIFINYALVFAFGKLALSTSDLFSFKFIGKFLLIFGVNFFIPFAVNWRKGKTTEQ